MTLQNATPEKFHEAGVERHGADWYNANEAAASALMGTPLQPWNPDVKLWLPLAILRVLDRLQVTHGKSWNKENKRWE